MEEQDEQVNKKIRICNENESNNICTSVIEELNKPLEPVAEVTTTSIPSLNDERTSLCGQPIIEKICVLCMDAGHIDCPLGKHNCPQCTDGALLISEVLFPSIYRYVFSRCIILV